MNEITRIHLARVAYEIELGAKKELDGYLSAIKKALDNDETLLEVEQRMSEILLEQNVKPGGVVTAADIAAIREQLGEPRDFGDEQADEALPQQPIPKRLMRDLERKQLAGVAAGVSAYFGLDVVVVRLVFILLVLVNGFGLLLYLVLWAIMPPARSLSDRLGLRGQVATLDAYREYQGDDIPQSSVPGWLIALGRWVLGLGLLFVGWLPLVVGSAGLLVTFRHQDTIPMPLDVFGWVVLVAMTVGMIAFSVFMTTLGLAVLRWNFTRIKWPLSISAIIGMVSVIVFLAIGPLAADGYRDQIRDQRCSIPAQRQSNYCTQEPQWEVQSL